MSAPYSILLPAYNEAAGLRTTLERLVAFVRGQGAGGEIVVIDDGSTDDTLAIAEAAARQAPEVLRVVHQEPNAGLVAGLRTGLAAARFDTVVVLDADLSYVPETALPMLEALRTHAADVALASPYLAGGGVSHVPLDRLIASRGANWILSACTLGALKTFTGMVRAYRAEVLGRYLAREPVGEFNAWLVAEALRDGCRVVEVPARLAWPPERYEAAPRITRQKLFTRALAVIRVACILLPVTVRSKFLKRAIGP